MVTIPTDRREQTLIYKTVDDRDVELLFFPPTVPNHTPSPLLIVIPGGGWRASRARSMYDMERTVCETLRVEGFAVAALSYRNRQDDGVNMRQIVTDVFDGAGYLAHHADVLGIDPTRFYTSGHSAGAHLALLLAYAPGDFLAAERVYAAARFTVRATAPLSPPTMLQKGDPSPYLAFGIDDLFEGCSDEDYRRFSPLAMAEEGRGVPTFTAVGAGDALVFPRNGERLTEALCAHGIRADIVAAQGGGHAFEPVGEEPVAPSFEDIQRCIVAFLLGC